MFNSCSMLAGSLWTRERKIPVTIYVTDVEERLPRGFFRIVTNFGISFRFEWFPG